MRIAIAIAIALLLTACSAPGPTKTTKVYDFDEVPLEGDLVQPTSMALVEPAKGVSPDAILLEHAEEAFAKNDMASAKAFYVAVSQGPSETLAPYARYKLGWVHYNLGEFKQALELFVAVSATRDPDCAPTALATQALRDVVLAYAEVGLPAVAVDFFRTLDPANWRRHCERLAELWEAQGRQRDAAHLLSILSETMD